jgi:hypothetical protein
MPGMSGMPGMPGLGGAEGGDNDFMKLLNTFAKDIMSGDEGKSDSAMDNIMN